MKKILIFTVLIQLLLSSCALDTIDMYKDEMHELIQDPANRNWKGYEKDVNNLKECQVLIKITPWKTRKFGMEKFKNVEYLFIRDYVWFDGNIMTETDWRLDFLKDSFSNKILNNKNFYPIYIGPWYYFHNIDKTIRFFAYYPKDGGNIQYQYESMTVDNKNIPEKKFSLSPNTKIAPDKFGLCVVKWTAKYGYNAVAEIKYPGFFNKIFRVTPVPTGKIIEVKE